MFRIKINKELKNEMQNSELLALRFEPSILPLRKNLLGSKRKANNIYFALRQGPTGSLGW